MEDYQFNFLENEKKKNFDIDPKYFYPKPKVWSSLISFNSKN